MCWALETLYPMAKEDTKDHITTLKYIFKLLPTPGWEMVQPLGRTQIRMINTHRRTDSSFGDLNSSR